MNSEEYLEIIKNTIKKLDNYSILVLTKFLTNELSIRIDDVLLNDRK